MIKLRDIIFTTIILASIHGCRAKYNLPQNTKTTKESKEVIKTKVNPFKLTATDRLTFDDVGQVKPLSLTLQYEDLFEGIVSIKKGIVEFTMENKDTLDLGTVVTDKSNTVSDTFVPVKQKLPKIFWWSIGINAFILLMIVLRILLRVIKPI